MAFVWLGAAVVLLLLLIVRFKFNAFLALLLASFAAALMNGMGAEAALRSILKGIGDTMGSLVLVLVFGAMLGKLIEESGAAHTISNASPACWAPAASSIRCWPPASWWGCR
jgi:H+/gluconate symporter-like permease